jgi:hypothetical protein
MDVRNFSAARDILYLSGALTGIAFGYILSLFRKNIGIHFRNRLLTLMLVAFSGALAAFSAAILVSRGDIFSSGALFFAVGACVPVFALAALFPRTVAYPLVLAGGLLAVWLGYSFLRFPPVAEGGASLVYVYHKGDNAYSVRIPVEPAKQRDRAAVLRGRAGQIGDRADKIDSLSVSAEPSPGPAGDRAAAVVFQINGAQPPLDIKGFLMGFHPCYPLIGGTARGRVTLIRRDNEILYMAPNPENSPLKTWYSRLGSFGLVFQEIEGTIPLDAIPQGANLAVSFTGEALSPRFSR